MTTSPSVANRLDRIEVLVEQLAESRVESEQRFISIESSLERLATAQERFAVAQERTEARLEQLVTAQEQLTAAQARTARQVGGLSETVGGDIEDIAYIVLHDVLRREFGWQVGLLERRWFRWAERLEEIDVFGPATDPARPGHQIWIVGEAKHNLTINEVVRFAKLVERARQHLEGELFPVCFCYRARPEVQQTIADAGLRLVFSYGKLV